MTALLDLPNELLEAIFREFLQKGLANCQYLCRWNTEPDARKTRANLLSLATVSQRLSDIALPLLYEQLFDNDDMQRILSADIAGQDTCFKHMAYVRYLKISPMETTSSYLEGLLGCMGISHLYLDLHGGFPNLSAFLLSLAKLPGLRALRSLRIRGTGFHDGLETLYQDCSQFHFLTGLHIGLGRHSRSMERPKQPLLFLKHLRGVFFADRPDISAFMALASSESLEILDLWTTDGISQSTISTSGLFGPFTWRYLEDLSLDIESAFASDTLVTDSRYLPALRNLRYTPSLEKNVVNTPLKLPQNLTSLEFRPRDRSQLLQCLHLLARKAWLVGSLERIKIVLVEEWLDDSWSGTDWRREGPTKGELVIMAQQAISAADTMGVVVKPENILDQIASLPF